MKAILSVIFWVSVYLTLAPLNPLQPHVSRYKLTISGSPGFQVLS